MNILVIGAGAIGCLVGGRLAQQGYPVTLVGRRALVDAVTSRGLVLTDERGAQRIAGVKVAGSLSQAFTEAEAAFGVAIVTVKSYSTDAMLVELVQARQESGARQPIFLSLQNGVGNEERLAAACGSACVIAGAITTPVSVESPGVIHVDRPSYNLGLSPWHPAIPAATLDAAHDALRRAGFAVTIYREARGLKWTKLLMNMLGNASSAILDDTPKAIFADPALADLEIDAWREALAVMQAAHIAPINLGGYPFGLLAPLVRAAPKSVLRRILARQVAGARGSKMPSLHMDLHAGKRQSEVQWLNGAVVAKGEEVGVATPVNRALTETLLSLVGNQQAQALWRRNSVRLVAAAQHRAAGQK